MVERKEREKSQLEDGLRPLYSVAGVQVRSAETMCVLTSDACPR